MDVTNIAEKEVAKRFLSVVLFLRDTEKLAEDGIPESFVEGYEEALHDLATWLTAEFKISEMDLSDSSALVINPDIPLGGRFGERTTERAAECRST